MLISEQIGPKVGRPRADDHWGQFQLGRIGLKTWLLWETPPQTSISMSIIEDAR